MIRGQFRGELELDQRRRLVSRRFQGLASQEFRWAYTEGFGESMLEKLGLSSFLSFESTP